MCSITGSLIRGDQVQEPRQVSPFILIDKKAVALRLMNSPETGFVARQRREQKDAGERQSQKIGKRQADQQPSELFQPVCPVEVKETDQHISKKAEGADVHKVIVADETQRNADCK